MGNYYLDYYQGGYDKHRPGEIVDKVARGRDRGKRDATASQEKYRKDLVAFLKKKGFEWPRLYMPPRSMKECSTKIRTMLTVLEKNGWDNEFFTRQREEAT